MIIHLKYWFSLSWKQTPHNLLYLTIKYSYFVTEEMKYERLTFTSLNFAEIAHFIGHTWPS